MSQQGWLMQGTGPLTRGASREKRADVQNSFGKSCPRGQSHMGWMLGV